MANVGTIDRAVRFIAGAALAAAPFIPQTAQMLGTSSTAFWAPIAVGAVLIATSVFSFCPAYRLMGMNTCRIR